MAIKTEDRSYERDPESQALLNTNVDALTHSRKVRERAARALQMEREMIALRVQLNMLTERVDKLYSQV